MDHETQIRILDLIDQLAAQQPRISSHVAQKMMMGILEPLLGEDGYAVTATPLVMDVGIDFFADRGATAEHDADRIGIEFKYYRPDSSISVSEVRSLIGATLLQDIDRAILLASSRFSKAAHETVNRELPVQIELVDLDALRAWAARLSVEDADLVNEFHIILKATSAKFASLIARNPNVLRELEWRDIERTIAEIFDGLGFATELTPCSKDGGKDVVLKCSVNGKRTVYVVEIKHWRSKTRVGVGAIQDFLKVIVRERRDGGLFLSTYGFCDNAFEQLSAIDRQRVRFGEEQKIVALCRTYMKAKSGIWSPSSTLDEILFEETE